MLCCHWNHNPFACNTQISRLLVVDPAARLSAEQALAHPFFRQYQKEDVRLFSPRKTFRVSRSAESVVFFGLNCMWKWKKKKISIFSPTDLVPPGADSERTRLHQDVRPLPQGSAANARGAGQRSLLPPRCPEAHRRLRLPHLRPLGEERGTTEPSSPLSEYSQNRAAGPWGLWNLGQSHS